MAAHSDIVLDDEAARDAAETLEVPRTTPEQRRAAGIALCAVAVRGFDVTDAIQRRAAARFARPALEALGLVAEPAPDDDAPDDAPTTFTPGTACGEKVGTITGYKRHLKAKDPTCRPCRDANAAYSVEHYRPHPRPPAPCGTKVARRRHRRHGEDCEHCWPVDDAQAAA